MPRCTRSREEASIFRAAASTLQKEAPTLAGIQGAEDLAFEKKAETEKLRAEALELDDKARLEDTSVFQEPYVRTNKNGDRKEYLRWRCSWMENGKSHKVYRGSCRIMTAEQALNRAKEKKAKALDLENG
jgi:hypothetical protein